MVPDWLLELVRCPNCDGELVLKVKTSEPISKKHQDIIDGELTCSSCNHKYEIVEGLPIFADQAIT
jgi:YgiT-type zinc finger domain-containing protein